MSKYFTDTGAERFASSCIDWRKSLYIISGFGLNGGSFFLPEAQPMDTASIGDTLDKNQEIQMEVQVQGAVLFVEYNRDIIDLFVPFFVCSL